MRSLLLIPLVMVACKQDVTLSQVEAQLSLPSPLIDLSAAVGERVLFTVPLEHLRGETAEILEINVVNIQGTAFSYVGETGLSLSADESLDLRFEYAPTEAGFDIGAIFIGTNARGGNFDITARGRAAVPQVEVFPSAIDFGPVAVGEPRSVQIRVDNLGIDPIDITATTTDSRFGVVGAQPLTVAAGSFVTVPVSYTPIDSTTVSAVLDLSIGSESLAAVQLRANDCTHGDPTLYDEDADGFTGCRGDCDDSNPLINPSALELANGIDDCDGTADEGTTSFDDDGDGYCEAMLSCTDGALIGDCNDGQAEMNPGAVEVDDNGLDDDCDGTVDLGASDDDGDGAAPPLDCDDSNPAIGPGAPEVLDGVDNNCDGSIDEGTAVYDDDGDGYCETAPCENGAIPGDCDDTNAGTSPSAPELPDWVDNNCDGAIDEGTVNEDADGDGFSTAGGDCNDADPLVNPALGNCP